MSPTIEEHKARVNLDELLHAFRSADIIKLVYTGGSRHLPVFETIVLLEVLEDAVRRRRSSEHSEQTTLE